MELPFDTNGADLVDRARFSVILVYPENQENIGLVARAMKNTGFSDLRIVGLAGLEAEAFRTAIHAEDILKGVRFYSSLSEATKSLHLVLASTARVRSKFSILPLETAVDTVLCFPKSTQIGLLFGNERTGLTSEELGTANFVFSIPQAVRQPSYNLASAVLLALFAIFIRSAGDLSCRQEQPMPHQNQEDCIRVVLMKLKKAGFIHETNETHVTRRVQDLFGRLTLTEKDRKLLMAIFNKYMGSDIDKFYNS